MAPDPKHDERTAPPPAPKRPSKIDDLLDEALEETFPASDPIAVSQPARRREHKRTP